LEQRFRLGESKGKDYSRLGYYVNGEVQYKFFLLLRYLNLRAVV